MSGKRYFFDTNAIVALLKGHPEVVGLAHKADFIAISVISRLEFFAFSALSQHDKQMFTEFVSRVEVLNLEMADTKLLDAIADIRIKRSLKLPDAIIMASAQSLDSVLVTADVKLAKAMESASYLFKPY
jgi:predicted nucleic acid-binding protein